MLSDYHMIGNSEEVRKLRNVLSDIYCRSPKRYKAPKAPKRYKADYSNQQPGCWQQPGVEPEKGLLISFGGLLTSPDGRPFAEFFFQSSIASSIPLKW